VAQVVETLPTKSPVLKKKKEKLKFEFQKLNSNSTSMSCEWGWWPPPKKFARGAENEIDPRDGTVPKSGELEVGDKGTELSKSSASFLINTSRLKEGGSHPCVLVQAIPFPLGWGQETYAMDNIPTKHRPNEEKDLEDKNSKQVITKEGS
jgi:hypothetical protein